MQMVYAVLVVSLMNRGIVCAEGVNTVVGAAVWLVPLLFLALCEWDNSYGWYSYCRRCS